MVHLTASLCSNQYIYLNLFLTWWNTLDFGKSCIKVKKHCKELFYLSQVFPVLSTVCCLLQFQPLSSTA